MYFLQNENFINSCNFNAKRVICKDRIVIRHSTLLDCSFGCFTNNQEIIKNECDINIRKVHNPLITPVGKTHFLIVTPISTKLNILVICQGLREQQRLEIVGSVLVQLKDECSLANEKFSVPELYEGKTEVNLTKFAHNKILFNATKLNFDFESLDFKKIHSFLEREMYSEKGINSLKSILSKTKLHRKIESAQSMSIGIMTGGTLIFLILIGISTVILLKLRKLWIDYREMKKSGFRIVEQGDNE